MLNKQLVIFDMCGTLYNWNSTIDYCRYLTSKWFKRWYNVFFYEKIRFLFFIFRKITGYDLERKIIVYYFKWLREKEISPFDNQFLLAYRAKMFRYHIFDWYLKSKDDTIIISASIDPPIRLFAIAENVPYYSSVLDKKNGVYTGALKHDLLGKKAQLITSKIINVTGYKRIVFITDNQSDTDLIESLIQKKISFHVQIVLNNNKEYWLDFFSAYLNKKDFTYEFIW